MKRRTYLIYLILLLLLCLSCVQFGKQHLYPPLLSLPLSVCLSLPLTLFLLPSPSLLSSRIRSQNQFISKVIHESQRFKGRGIRVRRWTRWSEWMKRWSFLVIRLGQAITGSRLIGDRRWRENGIVIIVRKEGTGWWLIKLNFERVDEEFFLVMVRIALDELTGSKLIKFWFDWVQLGYVWWGYVGVMYLKGFIYCFDASALHHTNQQWKLVNLCTAEQSNQ